MGYGNGIEQGIIDKDKQLKDRDRLKRIDALKNHPNYKDTYPYIDEDIISFTLRTASHLVSPKQEKGESYEVECVDIRDAILALKDEIYERFYNKR